MDSLRTLFPCLALVLLALFTFSEGREFLVGGQENSWKVPQSPVDFNKWAGKMRFLIGDSLGTFPLFTFQITLHCFHMGFHFTCLMSI
ncbi:hypothetical protein ACSBR1_025721 [Camellia fascicularis]